MDGNVLSLMACEFLAMKTLSGRSALRCDKAVTKFTRFGTDKMW